MDLLFTVPPEFQEVTPVDDQRLFELVTKLGVRNQDLVVVLDELLINGQEHGGGQVRLHVSVTDDSIIFRMKDNGTGIHMTVPKNPRLSDTGGKSSASILRLALEEGITGTGQVGRGMGLYYLSRFVRLNGAECQIASDHGCISQSGASFHERSLENDVGGTVIVLRVGKTEAGI